LARLHRKPLIKKIAGRLYDSASFDSFDEIGGVTTFLPPMELRGNGAVAVKSIFAICWRSMYNTRPPLP